MSYTLEDHLVHEGELSHRAWGEFRDALLKSIITKAKDVD
jgi:hypothetical protein